MILIYAFAFLYTICPFCASQDFCPAGQASQKLRNIVKIDEK
ncbi:MAG: hypothetical protein U9O98_10855 [Asgard group archaeon]|nr:hypothetical protein [Asgard group archaeon]